MAIGGADDFSSAYGKPPGWYPTSDTQQREWDGTSCVGPSMPRYPGADFTKAEALQKASGWLSLIAIGYGIASVIGAIALGAQRNINGDTLSITYPYVPAAIGIAGWGIIVAIFLLVVARFGQLYAHNTIRAEAERQPQN